MRHDDLLREGLLRPELFVGVVIAIAASHVEVRIYRSSGSHFGGNRYGLGEVGEYVLIEGQESLLLGRISSVRSDEPARGQRTHDDLSPSSAPATGTVWLTGTVAMDTGRVSAGVDPYPRLGDRVFSAPHEFIAQIPQLLGSAGRQASGVAINIGFTGTRSDAPVLISPERLFGRHCAILGATGGGKSFSIARIVGECSKYPSKVVLIDATGEYRDFDPSFTTHLHIGEAPEVAETSEETFLPPTNFVEGDFLAIFEPAGKVQGPKFRAAIRSLRLAQIQPDLATNGVIRKINQPKASITEAELNPETAARLDDPREPFDVHRLVDQIAEECVWPDAFVRGGAKGEKDPSRWGDETGEFSHCLPLASRISGAISSPALRVIFGGDGLRPLAQIVEEFFAGDEKRVLRICLSGVSEEYGAREIVANAIGRQFLLRARSREHTSRPVLVVVDEAHSFLGRHIGSDDWVAKLDSFEIIAKEGRKYGVNLLLASQRPRDIPAGVLSQMGTMVVHRLTNDHDRAVVERASGEIDKTAAAFLPNLRPGEAVVVGSDFPVPLTVRIGVPNFRPLSDGPSYQDSWGAEASTRQAEPTDNSLAPF